VMSAQVGQSFCTGKRRTGFAAGADASGCGWERSSLAMAPTGVVVS